MKPYVCNECHVLSAGNSILIINGEGVGVKGLVVGVEKEKKKFIGATGYDGIEQCELKIGNALGDSRYSRAMHCWSLNCPSISLLGRHHYHVIDACGTVNNKVGT